MGAQPAFVRDELEALLTCGDFEHGFLVAQCERCGNSLRVPFACKSRGISFFGQHHQLDRLPVMFAGGSASGLQTGRLLQLGEGRNNDTVLTSYAHLMGVPELSGFGDDPNCGPVPGLV